MTSSKNYTTLFLTITLGCSISAQTTAPNKPSERMCPCSELRHRPERRFYLEYHQGEDTFYTGKCKLTRDNGNEIVYEYLRGHELELVERYKSGNICEERVFDTLGNMTKRIRYYPNGQKSYERIFGDHTYETFYESGRINTKGGYGFTEKDVGNKYYNLYEVRLYDSIWKTDGSFDSVRHYSKAMITY